MMLLLLVLVVLSMCLCTYVVVGWRVGISKTVRCYFLLWLPRFGPGLRPRPLSRLSLLVLVEGLLRDFCLPRRLDTVFTEPIFKLSIQVSNILPSSLRRRWRLERVATIPAVAGIQEAGSKNNPRLIF